jgi:hypothetical protein
MENLPRSLALSPFDIQYFSLFVGGFAGFAIADLMSFALTGKAVVTESLFGLITEGVKGAKKVYREATKKVEELPE